MRWAFFSVYPLLKSLETFISYSLRGRISKRPSPIPSSVYRKMSSSFQHRMSFLSLFFSLSGISFYLKYNIHFPGNRRPVLSSSSMTTRMANKSGSFQTAACFLLPPLTLKI
ncbi:hypothetical protein CDAR_79331 [Caerostris darwini]|uniref:Uncharacterized protein n=1 Tax=Caerostris darwini TaxID=1538125 RepID=A0AAV4RHZ4_9ARAC|nr:hypothetical protein CDAR_79331 [Caerostris darwini]